MAGGGDPAPGWTCHSSALTADRCAPSRSGPLRSAAAMSHLPPGLRALSGGETNPPPASAPVPDTRPTALGTPWGFGEATPGPS